MSLFKWFELNLLKGNTDKHWLQALVKTKLKCKQFYHKNNKCEKRLGVTFDS